MASRIIGAAWRKEKNGKVFLSGVLKDLRGDINIAIFPNDRKEKDNQPDFNIVLSEQREERQNKVSNDPFAQGQENPVAGEVTGPTAEDEIQIENIPF